MDRKGELEKQRLEEEQMLIKRMEQETDLADAFIKKVKKNPEILNNNEFMFEEQDKFRNKGIKIGLVDMYEYCRLMGIKRPKKVE